MQVVSYLLFHVDQWYWLNNWLHFFKETNKSNSLLVQYTLPNLSIEISYFAYKCTQNVLTQQHSKVIASCVKQHLSNQPLHPLTLHPFRATTCTISHFGSTQASFYPQSSEQYTVYDIQCHMRDSVTYPILRCMLGYTNDQQLHHVVSPHDTWRSCGLTNILA